MSETSAQPKQQLPANVTTLQRQLEEMAARTKPRSDSTADRRKDIQGPVLVIRGK
jgi:hypothetical protein